MTINTAAHQGGHIFIMEVISMIDTKTINIIFSEVLMNLPLEKEVKNNEMRPNYRRR